MRAAALAVLLVAGALAGCLAPPDAAGYAATIRWTAYGIPHVTARDWPGLGYGYGYAFAGDGACVLLEEAVTLAGERSKWFGPDGTYSLVPGLWEEVSNEQSDVFYRFLAASPDRYPSPLTSARPELRGLAAGFAAGFNRWLAQHGADLPEPCRGAAWVQPLTEETVARRFQKLGMLLGSALFIAGIACAAPLAPPCVEPLGPRAERAGIAGLGSNAFAYGSAATASGRGLLLGNPHFPWRGPERLHEVHLTIPGQVDVMGASLYGVPLVLIGFNEHVAWSHTVSFARRFTLHELALVPGSPTTYLVDGAPEAMEPREVEVEVDTPQGPETRRHTVWLTRYGPVVDHFTFAGIPTPLPWTAAKAYALQDANARNDRAAEQFFRFNTAPSFDAFVASTREVLGLPWVHTVAASPDGRAFYGDVGVFPHVPDELLERCAAPLGRATQPSPLHAALSLVILDGSRSDCDWVRGPGPQEDAYPADALPSLVTPHYVINGNDSHWLPNPREPLEGYPAITGDERRERSARTRMGYALSEERLSGQADCALDPDAPCDRFTPARLEAALFDDRSMLGELVRDDLLDGVCGAPLGLALLPGASGPQDLREACDALRAWDLRADVDSHGYVLFDRFARKAIAPLWREPFDPDDPVGTPRGYLGADPRARQALADAAGELRAAGIALDAAPGDVWGVTRQGQRIPVHGGDEFAGVANVLEVSLEPGRGFQEPHVGSSYLQVVTWDEAGPRADALLTYGQSADPASPHAADQPRLFAAKQWVRLPFREGEVAAATVATLELRG